MDIIGAGWGRTGTTSAAAALDVLGFGPCVQMQTMWERPELAEAWAAHFRGAPTDWMTLLEEYAVSVDWPGAWHWRQFADLWPDSKILLTIRDEQDWYDSVLGSIHKWTAPGEDVGPPAVAALLGRVWDEHFGGWDEVFDRDRSIARYEAHVADVRRTCPAGRLVEWRVADGWPPLCEQLGVDVPTGPVPHLNNRSDH